jgi:MFS-type transporter involved in bile tolerance (Atg22 family)
MESKQLIGIGIGAAIGAVLGAVLFDYLALVLSQTRW